MKSYETLTEAIEDLKKRGYDHDFNLDVDHIRSAAIDIEFRPEAFEVDEVYRFEGMTNPGDNMVLFAVRCKTGEKGVLMDAMGADGGEISMEMAQKLRYDPTRHGIPDA